MSDGLQVQAVNLAGTLLSDVEPARRRREWGGWRLNRRTRELVLPGHYEVDLDWCRDAGQVLDWIAQVATKSWATDEVLAGLVRALDDVLNVQRHVCSGGANTQHLTRTDVRRLVKEAPPARAPRKAV